LKAERGQLNLVVNLSELENRQMLDAVEEFEKGKLEENLKETLSTILRQFDETSIGRGEKKKKSGEDELKKEIERIRGENGEMRRRLEENESKKKQDNELEKFKAGELERELLEMRRRLEEVNGEVEHLYRNTCR
jgi:hypothetical protein